MCNRGKAQSEWLCHGNAVRRVSGLPFAEIVILPTGHALALIPARLSGRAAEAAFESLLWRLWLARFGDAAVRAQMRGWLDEGAAD